MRREDVYHAIDGERDYQDNKWGTIEHHGHEVGAYITLMRKLLNDAEAAWAGSSGDEKAMHEIRKVISVGVACAEEHGMPFREEP